MQGDSDSTQERLATWLSSKKKKKTCHLVEIANLRGRSTVGVNTKVRSTWFLIMGAGLCRY